MSNVGYLREILPTSKPSFDRKLMIMKHPQLTDRKNVRKCLNIRQYTKRYDAT